MNPKTIVELYGRLRVQGNKIVGQTGTPVMLRGVSFFWSQWIGKYYNRDVVNWLVKDWKCTIVRAALAVDPDGYLVNPEQESKKVSAVVDAAIKAGIYVLIDWHDHEAHKHTAQSLTFFRTMAKKYGKYPNVIFETYNEPLENVSWPRLIKPYHTAVIQEIRKYAPDSLVICGNRMWSQRVDEAAMDPLPFPNIAYTLHYYASTHKQYLRDIAQKALDSGVALMVTEFGTTEATGDGKIDYEESRKWWDFLDERSISWCNWSIADKKETSAILLPGASERGNWPDSAISPSGLFVRDEIRKKNTV